MPRSDNFTTFMGIVEDPAFDAKVNRFAQTGARGFARITMEAQRASEAVNKMIVGRGTGGLGGSGASVALQREAAAARLAARGYSEMASVTPRAAAAQRQQTREAQEGTRANQALARSLTATATALNVVQGPLGPLAGRFGAAARAIGSLGGVQLGSAAFGGLAFAIARMGNSFVETEGKLRPFFNTQREVNRAMGEVVGIANRSRASLSATADLYTRLTANVQNYGWTQMRVGRITELASKAATLSGGSRQSQEAGLYQFSQAIGSNRLGGDELRSILENTNQLANAVAQGMGVSVGELRKLGEEGVLTANVVAAALERSADTIEGRFARLPRTLGSAATEFGNNLTVTIGHLDRAIGLSRSLAGALSLVGGNLNSIIPIAAGIGAAFGAIKLTRWIGEIQSARAGVQALNFQTLTLFENEMNVARTRAAHGRDYIASLRQQKAALRANIADMASELRAVQGVQRRNADTQARGGFVAPSFVASTDARAAELRRDLSVATRDLDRVSGALVTSTRALSVAEREAVAAQQMLNVATGQGVEKGGRLGQTIGNIVRSAAFWNVAILALGVGLGILASQQSAAERANDRAAKQMQEYSRVVDEATGRVRDLTEAERARALSNSRETLRRYEARGEGEAWDLRSSIRLSFEMRRGAMRGGRLESPLSRQLTGTTAEYEAAIQRIQQLADAGDEDMRTFLERTQDNRDALQNLGDAARAARGEIEALSRGIDSQVAARLERAAAEFEAALPGRIAAIRDRSRDMSTLNDNARLQRNLNEVYQELGRGPSGNQIEGPEQIRARGQAITNFTNRIASAIASRRPREEIERMRATLRGMTEDARRAMRESRQVMGTAGELARERTQAQTAERDQNRAEAAQRAAERAAERAQRQQERQRDLLDRRQNVLTRYDDQPTIVQRAITSIRELEDIQRSLGRGLYPDEAMRADVERIRQGVRRELRELVLDKRQDIVGRYIEEPTGILRAERSIQELRRLQQQVGNGIYPADVMAQDEARIRQGVLKPFNDIVKEYGRQRQLQLLTLQGRTIEAEALRQAFSLVDSIGHVTESQFTTLVRQAEQQQRINDVLAQRERILAPINQSVEVMRSSLEDLLMNLERGPAAGLDFLRSIQRNFRQIWARSLTESLTQGMDSRVRNLISARSSVDSAYREFASQLTTTGNTAMDLAQSNRRAGELMLQGARDFLEGIRALPMPGGTTVGSPPVVGAPGGTPSGTDLGNWITGGSGAEGWRASGGATPQQIAAPIAQAISFGLERIRLPFQSGMSSGWGVRGRPMPGATANHTGIDWAKPRGTPVQAAFSGQVVQAGPYRGYGNAVILDHGNGLRTLYGHLDSVAVSLQQIVRQGDRLGGVGSTGVATGNNLHFGVYRNGRPINPLTVNSWTPNLPGGVAAATAGAGPTSAMADVDAWMDAQIQQINANTQEWLNTIKYPEVSMSLGGGADFLPPPDPQSGRTPTARETYNVLGAEFGRRLDSVFGTRFFQKMGGSFGTALQGAGEGAIASGFARALGLKQSKTGAEIGGALGSLIPQLGPFGGFIGGLIGGTLGGLLKKSKTGSATISMADFGGYSVSSTGGNNKQRREAAEGIAGSFIGGLEDIARQLGGTVGNFGSISFGVRNEKFVVDPTGRGRTKGGGVEKFESEQEAIARAIELAISRGAIEGISAASQRILKSGQDLQRALEKASIIESIPRRLLQRTNPVRFAVEELNRDFSYMIQVLKEAAATSEQFAQAQQLYELERADAVRQAAESMFGQIEDYLKEMVGGSSSPLNKRTVYDNARAEFQKQVADTADGIFSQEDLLNAARNFQEAARSYKGSSAGFFSDFDWIFGALTAARDAASGLAGGVSELPGSPFTSDPAVQAAIDRQIDAIDGTTLAVNYQTDVLYGAIQELIERLSAGDAFHLPASQINQLPGFQVAQ